ncbi:MAG: energy-coupling factor transporter transmembrane protein EcfT [Treponema sp.]|jgi:energy-coupling factor transport system permease protein|nr:energy-coupling factor transporter transmembrane protein EcfT [Treponema sp.]
MSVIYKLDPRIKILLVLFLTALVFYVDKLSASVCLLLSFLAFLIVQKIPFRGKRSLFILSMLAVFIILTQMLFGPGENYIIKPLFPSKFPLLGGMGSLKWDGLAAGLVVIFRLVALMLLLPILTATTGHERIAAGLCALGFNYRIAVIITTAFNLIPLFEENARVIMDAQKLRGMRSFEGKSFPAKLKAYPTLVVPLMLGAMRKAQAASVAMDSRAFGVYKTRTWTDKPVMKAGDFISAVICVIFAVVILLVNFWF